MRVEIKVFPTILLDDGSRRTKNLRMWIRNTAWKEQVNFFCFLLQKSSLSKGFVNTNPDII
jgi:hypothetical protein